MPHTDVFLAVVRCNRTLLRTSVLRIESPLPCMSSAMFTRSYWMTLADALAPVANVMRRAGAIDITFEVNNMLRNARATMPFFNLDYARLETVGTPWLGEAAVVCLLGKNTYEVRLKGVDTEDARLQHAVQFLENVFNIGDSKEQK